MGPVYFMVRVTWGLSTLWRESHGACLLYGKSDIGPVYFIMSHMTMGPVYFMVSQMIMGSVYFMVRVTWGLSTLW